MNRGSRFSLRALAVTAPTVVVAVVACTSTPDPRPGVATGPTNTSPPPTSTPTGGGSVDADVPDAAVDCGPAPAASGTFDRPALLGAAATCAAWHACTFQNAIIALRQSAHEGGDSPNDDARAAVRAAWRTAMDAWSGLELFQFGPIASKTTDKYHGRGLRSFVHPWPATNRCQVETQIATKGYATDGFDLVVPGGRGLFAVEYVFFHPGVDTACLPNAEASKIWATLSADDLVRAKVSYARAVSDDLAARAAEITNVWASDGENFGAKLLAHEGYGSEQETLNVVAWSLLYVEKEVKDWKLAGRAGVAASAPDSETPFAGIEIDNVRTNLRAFRRLFQGCGDGGEGIGFDDWLTATGASTLATDMLAALDGAEAAAAAFPPFAQATTEQFSAFYGAIKPLSDLLKNSFFGSGSPLNLKLPASAASDTD